MHFQPGLPKDVAGLFPTNQKRSCLLILDDLMQESAKSPQITQLLMRSTHHLELFTITLSQNLYPGGREQVSQNHNYHYTVLFNNPADTRYLKALGNRWLGDSRTFWQVYQQAMHRPFGYLVINHHPRIDETIRFCTHILLDEPEPVTVLQAATLLPKRRLKKADFTSVGVEAFVLVFVREMNSVVLPTFRRSAFGRPPRSLQAPWDPHMPGTHYVLQARAPEGIIPWPAGLPRAIQTRYSTPTQRPGGLTHQIQRAVRAR